jgi:hypothetical protein
MNDIVERIDNILRLGESTLTTKERKALPKSDFVVPSKAPGSGSYPIPDISHARNALARAAQHGSSALQKKVRAKVYDRFPELNKKKEEKKD